MRGVLAALVLLAAAAPVAAAAEYPTGWNGANPFACELQQAGFGPVGPHPEADPYCVEFDKRHQNVTQLGVVDFLSQEPARVAAASDKCFYFQSDHWRGSVVQGDGSTKTYEWDGHYFFDKARGEGGAWVTNFNFNGRTQDPGQVPGVPAEYARWFGPGTGGVITRNGMQADPRCVEKASKAPPYAAPRAGARGCLAAKGGLDSRAVGGVRLGDTETRVRGALGAPQLIRRGFLRWCYQDGTSLRVGEASDRSGDSGTGAGHHKPGPPGARGRSPLDGGGAAPRLPRRPAPVRGQRRDGVATRAEGDDPGRRPSRPHGLARGLRPGAGALRRRPARIPAPRDLTRETFRQLSTVCVLNCRRVFGEAATAAG